MNTSTTKRTMRRTMSSILGIMSIVAATSACTTHADPDAITRSGEDARTSVSTKSSTSITGTVVSVYDGDTMTVRDTHDGRKVKVRLLGIDAPEMDDAKASSAKSSGSAKKVKHPQCGALAARDTLRSLAPVGSKVTITTDTVADTVDRYGRTLGYVATPSTADAAKTLVERGLVEAWTPRSEPRPSRTNDLEAAMQAAKAARTGSWATCPSLGR